MIYPHRVSFQAPAITRLPSGQEVRSYDEVGDLTDLPARVIPAVSPGEQQQERMVTERDAWTIVVQGDHDIDVAMRAVTSGAPNPADLDVLRVQRPVLYGSSLTHATIVTAQLVTASGSGS